VLLRRALQARFDLLIVAFRAHSDIFLAGLIAKLRGVPLIFDPLTSRYEERVVDRRQVSESSLLARWYRLSDSAGCRLADCVLLETTAQIDYFTRTFGLSREKCRRVWLSADDEMMRPAPAAGQQDAFTVFFYGRFSPLHGIEHILEAAALLERRHEAARFVIVGAGQTYDAMRTRAAQLGVSSVTFMDPVPRADLAMLMASADVCLGTFGTNARARRVIPYKVFDALAVGRPVITADTPAIREALAVGEDVWTCPSGDSGGLADAIVMLKRDPQLRRRLADNGHRAFRERLSPEAISRDLIAAIGECRQGGRAHPVPR
jgi:glycosyltransferase involved in cell wall biosynthesis